MLGWRPITGDTLTVAVRIAPAAGGESDGRNSIVSALTFRLEKGEQRVAVHGVGLADTGNFKERGRQIDLSKCAQG